MTQESQWKWDEPLPEKLDKDSKFELLQFLGGSYWLARNKTDGRQYIAKKMVDFSDYHDSRLEQTLAYDWSKYMTKAQRYAKGLEELVYEHKMSRHVSFVMNHENLVSFAGSLRHKPHNPEPFDDTQATEDYLLWDFCNAGSLELLLVNKGQKPPLIGKSFLEEPLCWHVLTSVMRALTWLHDGYRRNVDFDSENPRDYEWICSDLDWVPILHRKIAGTTILFQHPEGAETYGQCKLGDMRDVSVCSHPADRFEDPVSNEKPMYNAFGAVISPAKPRKAVSPPEATNKDREQPSVRDMRKGIKAWKEGAKEEVAYTISDDHWALGSVVFRMMTARYLPSYRYCTSCDGCRHVAMCKYDRPCTREETKKKGDCRCESAGCSHILDTLRRRTCNHWKWKSTGSCDHGCRIEHLNIDDTLAQHDYSWLLIDAVRLLFNSWNIDNLHPARNSRNIATEIERLYSMWRKTPEGMDYVDVEDDVKQRYVGVRGGNVDSDMDLD